MKQAAFSLGRRVPRSPALASPPALAPAAAPTALALAALALGCPQDGADTPDPDDVFETEEESVHLQVVADDLEHPWSLAFLPDGDALVTERPGRLSRLDVEAGETTEIESVPEVFASGQGGLLDVALHPDFEESGWVYLTYAGPGDGGAATHLGRGRLEGGALADFEVLFVAEPFVSGGRHFGSRAVFDDDGYLVFTVGDRGRRELAQDRSNAIGATLRLEDDGEVPGDNPFVGEDGVEPAIYSYGHRNVQGMTVHPETGRIWQHEHGPRGGDEINLPAAGENFGWPLASYGVEYQDGSAIGPDPRDHADTVSPIYYWEESFAPSGMTFYDGDEFPAWRGDLFMGALALEHLARLPVRGEAVEGEEALFEELGWRIRDVVVGPRGHLYVLVDASSAPVVRIVPAEK